MAGTEGPDVDATPTDVAGETLPAPLAPTLAGAAARGSGSLDTSPSLVAGRYELVGLLGAGAMGTVYRARDLELDELVALKVLRRELAAAEGMLERFRREVKLARRVTHRNVARTYDIGEHGGDRFLTMEFIEGEMLGTVLAHRGRLPPQETIEIARAIAAGLEAAHAANVLHRDLKPENVIIANDGRVVITDFGIARALADAELAMTAAGGVAGTPAYMAPEQVEGATDLDPRADLYALGTMMYELLTATLPWRGDSVVAIAAARLLRPPPDVRAEAPEIPAPIAELVSKLMARRREDRFASAADVTTALDGLRRSVTPSVPPPSVIAPSRRGTPGERSVAVLPVLSASATDDAYLAQSITEDVVDLLSAVPGIRVRPRGQAARYVSPSRDVREAGRALGVDVVVDASLRRVGNDVRVNVRLVTVEDGFQLWAQRFQREASEVLSIADEAAAAVARMLASELLPRGSRAAVDPEAQDLYLRARYVLHRGWTGASTEAAVLLEKAYARAPDDPRIGGTYALALARTFIQDSTASGSADAIQALVQRVLEQDPTQAEARVARGVLHMASSALVPAAEELQRALATSPNAVDALDGLGRIAIEVGQHERGVELLERAIAIDPNLAHARFHVARALALLRDYDGYLEKMGPPPSHPGEHATWILVQARTLISVRDTERARRLLAHTEAATSVPSEARDAARAMLRIATNPSEAAPLLERIAAALPVDESRTARRACFNAQLVSEAACAVGDTTRALEALRAADARGLADVFWLERCEALAPLRSEPDFARVLAATKARAAAIAAVLALD